MSDKDFAEHMHSMSWQKGALDEFMFTDHYLTSARRRLEDGASAEDIVSYLEQRFATRKADREQKLQEAEANFENWLKATAGKKNEEARKILTKIASS